MMIVCARHTAVTPPVPYRKAALCTARRVAHNDHKIYGRTSFFFFGDQLVNLALMLIFKLTS